MPNAGGFVLGARPAPGADVGGPIDYGGDYGYDGYGGYQAGYDGYGGYQSADGAYEAAYGYGEGDRPGSVPHRRRRRTSQPTGSGYGATGGENRKKNRSRRRRPDQSGSTSSSKLVQWRTKGLDISQAELAAATIETWAGLERGGGSSSLTRSGQLPPEAAHKVHEAEREAEALRVLLKEERRRITKEVRSLKGGWEAADKQSREFEQQALALRCSEAVLTRELATADKLTDWWRQTDLGSKRRQEELMAAAKEQSDRAEKLTAQLKEAKLHVTELTTALTLHEKGRDNLRIRLAEKDKLLDETRANAAQKVLGLEDMRKQEMATHKSRIEAVTGRVVEVMDQLRRARLDVDDWARSVKTYETLLSYLKEEEKYAIGFYEHARKAESESFERERKALNVQLASLDDALGQSASQRLDLIAEVRRATSEGEARRAQQAAVEAARLREQLAEAERSAASRDELAQAQLEALKGAFRADVEALSGWVKELREASLKANVYARSSTRLLRQQNGMLKQRIGHNALLARQRQRRLTAWLGWKMVVLQGRALRETSLRRQHDVGERNGMIEQLEGRLGETRSKYLRQLHSLQAAHESELDAAREELHEAREAMARLKTFSAHKLARTAPVVSLPHGGLPSRVARVRVAS